MQVAVIGCGPAGLAAAHAAAGLASEVTIWAPPVRSPQRGPLLLQRPIPGITTDHPDGYIRQIVIGGSILDYRYKLYGDINISIQGNILRPGYHCWDHIAAYDRMWAMYMDTPGRMLYHHIDEYISPKRLYGIHDKYDLVVNTAPLMKLCVRGHKFTFKQVDITMGYSYPDQPEDTIIFNAGDKYDWVRSSRVLGNSCTEWLIGTAPPVLEPFTIRKPISHDCNCFPRVLGTGRFGAWRNETWVDTAYYAARDAIISMQRQDTWNQVQ